jgi:CubicO group peptidase (beta-lactamase class C family)
MQTYEVPGMAIAIVKDGKFVLQKGYGVRKLGDPARVDADTLFGIGSITKTFTTAAVATLVDAGKLSWDDPVYERLPDFQMYDRYVSRELRIRDLLCHRGGLGYGEGDLLLWPPNSYTRDDIVHRLRFLKPVTSFRSVFAYNNLMFVAAGQVIAKVSGESWDDYLRQKIFLPLGMKNTNSSMDAYRAGANWASPHSKSEGKLHVVPFIDLNNTGAAGSINSSAADMARWLLVQLNHGKIPGTDTPLFSEKSATEMWTQQSVIPVVVGANILESTRPQFYGYGLGWFLQDYKGRKLVGHPGGVGGFVTRLMLVPEEKLGVVILTNSDNFYAFESILNHILDSYLGGPTEDYIASFKVVEAKSRRDADETLRKAQQARAADSKPSLAPAEYAGDYTDPWYGKVLIRAENSGLTLKLPLTGKDTTADLQHWQFDTFKAHWRDRTMEDAYVTFALKADGSIDHFTMAAVSPLADFSADYQDLYFTPSPAPAKSP